MRSSLIETSNPLNGSQWRKFITCVFFMIPRVCNPVNFSQNYHHSIYGEGYKM